MTPENPPKKRQRVDFSKHEITEIKTDDVYIIKFRRPDTSYEAVYFLNACGVLSVTGDWGNWIFCREFHPGGDYVSGGYWDEKLEISSQQKAKAFDPQKTEDAINRRMKEKDCEPEEREYLNEMLRYVSDGEILYQSEAYNRLPQRYDHYTMIFEKSRHFWLDVVYDAYDEITYRMKVKAQENE
jgi:hypothetical protein